MTLLRPRFSIVIPTRNGGDYIQYSVQSVLCQDYDNCELIVSVNHSSDDTLKKLSVFKDDRLRIISPPEELPLPLHYEWCLNHVKGEWVIIIGDDDGLMPYFFTEADALIGKSKQKYFAYSIRRAYFFWPGCESLYGKMVVSLSGYRFLSKVSSWSNVYGCLLGSASHIDLPEIYACNLVHHSLIDKIRKLSQGFVYHDQSPDVYSGVAVASVCAFYGRSELPLIWVGSSPKSIGYSLCAPSEIKSDVISSVSMIVKADTLRLERSPGPCVAKEVGNDLVVLAQSDPLLVLSALLKIPFRPVFYLPAKSILVWIAFSRQWADLKRIDDSSKRDRVRCLLLSKARSAKIGIAFLRIGSLLVKGWRILNLFYRRIALACNISRQLNSFDLYSLDRNRFPSLREANLAASEWYKKLKDIHEY